MTYTAAFDPIRTFGVELEFYGIPKYLLLSTMKVHGIPCVEITNAAQAVTVPVTWAVKGDGSVHGNEPAELVSPVLSGEAGLHEVARVCDLLYALGCEVNWSCGFHVHHNCGDYTGKNMLSLLRLYAKFEPTIDLLVAPSRRLNRNDHCLSLCKDEDLSWITALDPSERKRAFEIARAFSQRYHMTPRGSCRHHKVNIASYNRLRTVEFRQHQGTLEWEKALNWILFTQQLVSKAKQVAVSPEPTAKQSLGELLRSLRLREGDQDPLIAGLAKWMKKRYAHFKSEEAYNVEGFTHTIPAMGRFAGLQAWIEMTT